MLNSVSLPGASAVDLYPAGLAAEIDTVNDLVHNNVSAHANLPVRSVCSMLNGVSLPGTPASDM